MGYRFVFEEVGFTSHVIDHTLVINVALRNEGAAPFYYDWPLQAALLDPSTRQPIWTSTFANVDIASGWAAQAGPLQTGYAKIIGLSSWSQTVGPLHHWSGQCRLHRWRAPLRWTYPKVNTSWRSRFSISQWSACLPAVGTPVGILRDHIGRLKVRRRAPELAFDPYSVGIRYLPLWVFYVACSAGWFEYVTGGADKAQSPHHKRSPERGVGHIRQSPQRTAGPSLI